MPRLTRKFTVGVYLAVALCASAHDYPVHDSKEKNATASDWANSIAGFVAEPNFYRLFDWAQARLRFAPLFEPVILDETSSTASGGRNLSKGVLWMDANLQGEDRSSKYHVLDIDIVLKRTGPSGKDLYPFVRQALGERFKRLPWKLTYEKGRYAFWRKGKSHFVVSVQEADQSSLGHFPETPPFVIVIAGEEQGDSENP